MEPAVNTAALSDYHEPDGAWFEQRLCMTDDKRYALFFYNISETSMMAYHGTFAIFAGNDLRHPLVTLKSGENRTFYKRNAPFYYAPLSDCIVTVYNQGQNCMPFLLIQPTARQFALLPSDFTSIYYALQEQAENRLEFTEERPREIAQCVAEWKHRRQTGRVVELNTLRWYPLSELPRIVSRGERKRCRCLRTWFNK